MVHQHFTLAENLSGLDNIVLGTEPVWQPFRDRSGARRRIEAIMAESGLTVDLRVQVANLTVGEKQRIEILKALYRDVRVLILDEPTAVLTPQEADGLFVVLRRLAAKGLGVIFISHKLGEVLAVSHRIMVLRGGKKAGEIPTAGADRRAIADLMVGRAVEQPKRTRPSPGRAGPRVRPRGPEARLRAPVAERSELHPQGRGDRRPRRRLRQRAVGDRRADLRAREARRRRDAPLRQADPPRRSARPGRRRASRACPRIGSTTASSAR